mmetsp:Transcript_42770/g.100436  ORF Transcript_42770/g.100436 Transcript_42770/m.100436 type:complete len:96 (-) Transcript_42770:2066-2353(-)
MGFAYFTDLLRKCVPEGQGYVHRFKFIVFQIKTTIMRYHNNSGKSHSITASSFNVSISSIHLLDKQKHCGFTRLNFQSNGNMDYNRQILSETIMT